MTFIENLCQATNRASKALAEISDEKRTQVLTDMANALRLHREVILQANRDDITEATKRDLPSAMIDRLLLNYGRIEDMALGLETVAELSEVVGQVEPVETRPNGLSIAKMKVPLGVICMIYEARPNVTADAAGLCIKSGNAIILRCGKEALVTSLVIATVLQDVLTSHGLPKECITVISDPDRELMKELLQQNEYINLVIPRGGEALIRFVDEHSNIPVIKHYKGVCHLYVNHHADLDKALSILENGKTSRTGVCNALECLLVDEKIAPEFLPRVSQLFADHGVFVNACKTSLPYFSGAKLIDDASFGQEYLCLEIAVKVVPDIEAAIEHIDEFGSNHTEVICTESEGAAVRFQQTVDASVVMVNASSRFSDGAELGLGAEIGIATTKLHAYGPMGIESLTTEKFLVNGTGQVRA